MSNLNHQNVRAFLREFQENVTCHNQADRRWNTDPDIILEASIEGNCVSLDFIENSNKACRKKGKASRALDWFCQLADKHHVRVTLMICPVGLHVGEPVLDRFELNKWYRSRGFDGPERAIDLIRKPK